MHPFVYIAGQRILPWFMLFLIVGFTTGLVLLVTMRPSRFCLSRTQITVLLCLVFLYGMIGARAFHIILYYHKYVGRPFGPIWRASGMSSMGAIIFTFLTVYIYSRITKKPALEIYDHFALIFPPLVFLGRISCLLHGCCIGHASSLPWATVFSYTGGNIPRHPTQAYEMIYALSIALTTLRFYPRLKNIRGATFFLIFFTYFFLRFFNEFLRADSPFIMGPLKLSHLGMITGVLLCSIGIYYVIFKKGRKQELLNLLPKMAKTFVFSLVIVGFIILSLLTIF